MLRVLIPLSFVLTTQGFYNQGYIPSAASEAQIRFAIENKYDDTGPGAKEQEYAYNTYSSLDDALVGYLDDPDTKLPESERNRAIEKLTQEHNQKEFQGELLRFYPKTVEEYTGYMSTPKPKPQRPILLSRVPPKKFYQDNIPYYKEYVRGELAEPYKIQKLQPVRGNPLSTHYARDPDLHNAHDQFNPHPKYTFSYGVHVPDTGDSKSAQETREGGTVKGYYSFMDADGKQRTVHYTADDKLGFRATVERTNAEHTFS